MHAKFYKHFNNLTLHANIYGIDGLPTNVDQVNDRDSPAYHGKTVFGNLIQDDELKHLFNRQKNNAIRKAGQSDGSEQTKKTRKMKM